MPDTISEKVDKIFSYAKTFAEDKNFMQALLKAIPYFGDSLEEILYGSKKDEFINKFYIKYNNDQEKVQNSLDTIINTLTDKKNYIMTIGGGNSENVLSLCETLSIGTKHIVDMEELFGGSSVNHTVRLLTAGYPVFPILAIGEDEIGRKIKNAILETAKKNNATTDVIDFIENSKFLSPDLKTASTTILVHNSKRTIFTQKLKNGSHFFNHVEQLIKFYDSRVETAPSIVMIGHIQSDSAVNSNGNPGNITKFIIDNFYKRSVIYTNFGSTQINLGYKFWKNYLPKIDIFQLNLEEAKIFFSEKRPIKLSLKEIVEILRRENINAIITLDRFGAIGIHKEQKKAIILAWPILNLGNVVDPTGSGDAFASGVAAQLSKLPKFSPTDFQAAIDEARFWSALACKGKGGCGSSPTRQEIHNFKQQLNINEMKAVEVRDREFAAEVMTLLDIAFQ